MGWFCGRDVCRALGRSSNVSVVVSEPGGEPAGCNSSAVREVHLRQPRGRWAQYEKQKKRPLQSYPFFGGGCFLGNPSRPLLTSWTLSRSWTSLRSLQARLTLGSFGDQKCTSIRNDKGPAKRLYAMHYRAFKGDAIVYGGQKSGCGEPCLVLRKSRSGYPKARLW